MDLRVLEVKQEHARRSVRAPLPNPSFCLCLVAPPRSGKSTFIANVIRNEHWKYRWESVVIVSPTAALDQTFANILDDEDVRVYDDPSALETVIATCTQEQVENRRRMLMVVDDCVGYMGKALEKLASKYRHYGISLIVSSQQFRMIPPTVRTCAGYWILFRTHNRKEVAKMVEEFSGQFPFFEKAYMLATREKYHFLFIDVGDSTLRIDFGDLITEGHA